MELPLGDSLIADCTPDGRHLVFLNAADSVMVSGVTTSGFLNVYVRDRATGETRLVSVNHAGTGAAAGHVTSARISANGRYVVFASEAADLVSNDHNGAEDVFLRDLEQNLTVLISQNLVGSSTGNGRSWSPVLTPDGSRIAFVSAATDLVADDTNGFHDVFVRELTTGHTTRVSLGPILPFPSFYEMYQSESPAMSDDGRRIAFMSSVYNLIPSRRTTQWAIFMRDLDLDQTLWISTNVTSFSGGNPLNCNNPVLSPDGAWLAFKGDGNRIFRHRVDTATTALVTTTAVSYGLMVEDLSGPAMTSDGRFIAYAGTSSPSGYSQIYRWDAETGQTLLISANPLGAPGNGISDTPRISADGRRVIFLSHATDLLGEPPAAAASKLYLRDVESGSTRWLSPDPTLGTTGDRDVPLPWLSADDTVAFFDLLDTRFAEGDLNRSTDLFEADFEANTVALLSIDSVEPRSATAAGASEIAVQGLSADGRYVVLVSDAEDLVPGDANGFPDIFRRDLVSGATLLVSGNHAGTGSGGGTSHSPTISADGRYVAFQSLADNLVPGDTNGLADVFVRDLEAGDTLLVSTNLDGTGSALLGARSPAISGDGRGVAFVSRSPDLVAGETPAYERVFYRNLLTGQTVILGRDRPEFAGWTGCDQPVVAADGAAVVFQAQTFPQRALFHADLNTGVTRQVDEPHADAYFTSRDASLSADGLRVAFLSNHPTLAANDSNAAFDIFVRDIVSGTLWLVSANPSGDPGNAASLDPTISADGRWVAFSSRATDLVDGLLPGRSQVLIRDLEAQTTQLLSRDHSLDHAADGNSDRPVISGDGRHLAYRSTAAELTAGDDNGVSDVFLLDRQTGILTLVSAGGDQSSSANGPSYRPQLSRDGSTLVFKSYASDLIDHDYNQAADLFHVSSLAPGALTSLVLFIEHGEADSVSLRWHAISPDHYAVDYREDISIGDWQLLEAPILVENNWARVADTLPAGTAARYYRVRLGSP